MSAVLIEGRLVCEVCQKATEFDFVVKRGQGFHLCRKCRNRKMNQCQLCGKWKLILTHCYGLLLCARCAR